MQYLLDIKLLLIFGEILTSSRAYSYRPALIKHTECNYVRRSSHGCEEETSVWRLRIPAILSRVRRRRRREARRTEGLEFSRTASTTAGQSLYRTML